MTATTRARDEIGDGGLCGGTTRAGGSCTKPAGWGTEHPGFGACKLHGGGTPNAGLSAGRKAAVIMGAPIDIDPHEALIYCVQQTAGEVFYATRKIASLNEEEELQRPTVITDRVGSKDGYTETKELALDLHIWIRVRQEAMDRLARYSKMALDAGVDERRVAIAENAASVLAPILQLVFEDLKLTKDQLKRAPSILERRLLAIEGTATEKVA